MKCIQLQKIRMYMQYYMYIHIDRVHTYTGVFVCAVLHSYTHMHIHHICKHTYTHIHTHTHTYTHTYTHAQKHTHAHEHTTTYNG